jgi:xanthine dehydrogenase accessory factor
VAHRLFQLGVKVLVSEREHSSHARRGMAFIDALFEGEAQLAGVKACWCADLQGVEICWSRGEAVPVVTLADDLIVRSMHFDALVEATMRRHQQPPDLRQQAPLSIGIGPGFIPNENCHAAIETQWGPAMGKILRDRAPAARSGGPPELGGAGGERFVVAPASGTWRTSARLGQFVNAGELLGELGGQAVHAPIAGHLRGLTWDGVEVQSGQRVGEVDPRQRPDVFGLGERPQAIADGVAELLGFPAATSGADRDGR